MFDCQTTTRSFDALVDYNGTDVEFSFSFDGRVRRAAVAIQAFDVHYEGGDHYVQDLRVSANCTESPDPSNEFTANVNVVLKDKDQSRRIRGMITLVALVDRDPAYVRLRCETNQRYVCAVQGGGGEIVVDRTAGREWETFSLIGLLESGRSVSFGTWDGRHYLQSPEGDAAVNARGPWARVWETFNIYLAPGASSVDGRIRDGDRVVLEASSGYLVLDLATGRLVPGATDPSEGSVFTVHLP